MLVSIIVLKVVPAFADFYPAGTALDQKIAALSAMHTQVAATIALLGEDDFRALNAQEAFVEAAP